MIDLTRRGSEYLVTEPSKTPTDPQNDPIRVDVKVTRQQFEPPTLNEPNLMRSDICLCDCGSKAGGGSGG
ncbi:hypothetical protein [Raineyella fluvialis]|uniref:Uncharacterized protein n=1 Tax=Raineyella fluvialis TaxID=2662261 RepID=A0A5Q2FF91_9ACTN|nr:hypothetical protein [Raineyella fluvialis]QGF23773.1 hypothetical protein Rai3103_08905 [Raineyella fluvialis]